MSIDHDDHLPTEVSSPVSVDARRGGGVEDEPLRSGAAPWPSDQRSVVLDDDAPEAFTAWPRVLAVVAVLAAATVVFGTGVLFIVLALLISVALHEAGHFWVARRSGMKVTEYFIGIGPKIWSFQRGEVEYGVKAIPLAAYVKIIGMSNLEYVDPVDEPRTYRAQGTWKRVATVLAGPAANVLIGFVLFAGIYMLSPRVTDEWTVKSVESSAAADAGVIAGDEITTVNGVNVADFDGFRGLIDDLAGQDVVLGVQRGGEEVLLPATLGWRLNAAATAAIPSSPPLSTEDVVVAADGVALRTYQDLRAVLEQPGDPVTVAVERDGSIYELAVERPLVLPVEGDAGFLGVRADPVEVQENLIGAVGEAGRLVGTVTVESVKGLASLFSPSGLTSYVGQVSTAATENGSDPAVPVLTPVGSAPAAEEDSALTSESTARPISIVGIVGLGSDAADAGLASFLAFVALVNLALAIFNLLPVLPFDGGHAVIALYEGARGRVRGGPYRADITKLMPVVYATGAVLVLLAASSIMLDVLKPL